MLLLSSTYDNLHQILQNLYLDMMPLCSQMTGVAKGVAGLGALFYVAYRVWQSLSRAEPIDVFPLLILKHICAEEVRKSMQNMATMLLFTPSTPFMTALRLLMSGLDSVTGKVIRFVVPKTKAVL